MSLHYELEVLETLITESFHPKNLLQENSITDQQFESWKQLLVQEKEIVRKRLKKVTYTYCKEGHRKLYIQQHQFVITQLKNVLMEFLLPKDAESLAETKGDNKIAKLYKGSLVIMQELLGFIKEEFPQYFNYEERIPANILMQLKVGLNTRLAELRKQFVKAKEDASLIELVIQTILVHSNNETSQPFTYSRWQYVKELLNSLERMGTDEVFASHYPAMIVELVYMNFNATVFKNYFVKKIYPEINAGGSLQEKIEMISFHHKEISQLHVKPGMALAPSSPSVQLDLVTWLFNEMAHLEKKQTLGMVVPVEFKDKENGDKEKGIYSLYTIEEMGLLLKAHHETELIRNKNLKQAAKSMAEHWHSKYKENISWQYLYNSMSTIEMNTIKSLEDKLVGMVNWLRKAKGKL